MGTSVSMPSPKTTGWKAVSLGYIQDDIPIERVLSEIWRASQSQERPIAISIASEPIFRCQQIVRNSANAYDALNNVTKEFIKSKHNSIIGELARRSIPLSFKSDNPTATWRSLFFSEVTNYLMSRDISGYIGSKYRNRTVGSMIDFKNVVRQQVNNVMSKVQYDPSTLSEWKYFVNKIVKDISSELR